MRAKAAAMVDPVKQRILEILRGDGDGWSSRMLRLIAALPQKRARGAVITSAHRRLGYDRTVHCRGSSVLESRGRAYRMVRLKRRIDERELVTRYRPVNSMQMQQMRCVEAEGGDGDSRQCQDARHPGQRSIMPVMMVADASTMPIWKAAEAISK